LRFPGQYYDEETGLHYNWHRYYKPEWGRYVEADPLNIATIQIPPTSPIRMPVNRFSYSIILSPKAIMRDVNQLFILFVSDKKFYSGTLMAQMKKNILTPMILIYTQHPPFLNLFLYVVNNPLNYVDPSGKGVKGPWGNLPWFLEPPYCPFYQMGAWYLCWEECEEKKCKRKGCITQCVWEYYQGTGNPMYPLPGLSFE
jgi:RHS repeat-associated protein